jgi:thermolysin
MLMVVAGTIAIGLAAAHAQSRVLTLAVTTGTELRSWDVTISRMLRDDELRVRRTDDDPLLPSRSHERMDQYYKGVRVFGAGVVRQIDGGLTVSLFGTLHPNIAIEVVPRLSLDDAVDMVARESGVRLGPARQPDLVVLPEADGYRLAWHATVFADTGATEYFIDAATGLVIRRLDGARRQAAIGTGNGVLGDRKKVSVTSVSGTFQASDLLRPPTLITFDMRENLQRTLDFLNGRVALGPADQASDSDNSWGDAAAVDAHAYAGYVYDYFFKRFNRRGLDNNNLRILGLIHPVNRQLVLSQQPNVISTFYVNAFYAGQGVIVYGEGLPPNITAGGQRWDYLAGALDVVAHELTHGVTDFTSQLIYENESGALNESFSDMMGASVEFYYQPAGSGVMRADYVLGEDVITPGGSRSMENPGLFGQPDHYSKRFIAAIPTEANDNGGVHINSGIGNQAYYLAIEGGTNRTSGLSVQGVGSANREQIERVMYRAFTQLMPATATYATARAATLQAARDLYGASSTVERAITQAWTAVGVN